MNAFGRFLRDKPLPLQRQRKPLVRVDELAEKRTATRSLPRERVMGRRSYRIAMTRSPCSALVAPRVGESIETIPIVRRKRGAGHHFLANLFSLGETGRRKQVRLVAKSLPASACLSGKQLHLAAGARCLHENVKLLRLSGVLAPQRFQNRGVISMDEHWLSACCQ